MINPSKKPIVILSLLILTVIFIGGIFFGDAPMPDAADLKADVTRIVNEKSRTPDFTIQSKLEDVANKHNISVALPESLIDK